MNKFKKYCKFDGCRWVYDFPNSYKVLAEADTYCDLPDYYEYMDEYKIVYSINVYCLGKYIGYRNSLSQEVFEKYLNFIFNIDIDIPSPRSWNYRRDKYTKIIFITKEGANFTYIDLPYIFNNDIKELIEAIHKYNIEYIFLFNDYEELFFEEDW